MFEGIINSEDHQAYAGTADLDLRSGWLGSEEYRTVIEENPAYFEELLAAQ